MKPCGHPTTTPGCTLCAGQIMNAIRTAEQMLKLHRQSKPGHIVEVKLELARVKK